MRVNNQAKASSLSVKLNGVEILSSWSRVENGEILRSAGIEGLKAGKNEFFLEAFPALKNDEYTNSGIRIILLSGNQNVIEKTFWADESSIISGTMIVDL